MEKEGRGDGLNKIRKGRERRGGVVDVMGKKKEMKQEVGKVGRKVKISKGEDGS